MYIWKITNHFLFPLKENILAFFFLWIAISKLACNPLEFMPWLLVTSAKYIYQLFYVLAINKKYPDIWCKHNALCGEFPMHSELLWYLMRGKQQQQQQNFPFTIFKMYNDVLFWYLIFSWKDWAEQFWC